MGIASAQKSAMDKWKTVFHAIVFLAAGFDAGVCHALAVLTLGIRLDLLDFSTIFSSQSSVFYECIPFFFRRNSKKQRANFARNLFWNRIRHYVQDAGSGIGRYFSSNILFSNSALLCIL
jgi:hypothetical protein